MLCYLPTLNEALILLKLPTDDFTSVNFDIFPWPPQTKVMRVIGGLFCRHHMARRRPNRVQARSKFSTGKGTKRGVAVPQDISPAAGEGSARQRDIDRREGEPRPHGPIIPTRPVEITGTKATRNRIAIRAARNGKTARNTWVGLI